MKNQNQNYKGVISFEWFNTETMKESHKAVLDETALAHIAKMINKGHNEGELVDEVLLDDTDIDFDGCDGIQYQGCWKLLRGVEIPIENVPRGTSKDLKQEIIRTIKEMLETHGESVLNGEMDLDYSHEVETNDGMGHYCYEFFPTYAVVEIFEDGGEDAIKEYNLEYTKMSLRLVEQISKDLQEFFDRLETES